jgi:hypothetical protein
MGLVLFDIVAVLIILWFAHKYVRTNPTGMSSLLQKGGGVLAIVASVFALMHGGLAVALPLAFMGFGLLGWLKGGALGPWWGSGGDQAVRQRTPFLDVEIDQTSGAMRGRVTAGSRAGTNLDALDDAALTAVLTECDAESRKLLMAYLDRRRAGRREDAHHGAHARQGATPGAGEMSEQEAYQILGLEPGAGAEEIGRAYRALMKKLHPDQGGPTYLAARINQAKEVLLRRHH